MSFLPFHMRRSLEGAVYNRAEFKRGNTLDQRS